MTAVTFFTDRGNITGFYLFGHSTVNENDLEGKLVCSAVSSAAYMTVNTITEIIGANVDAEVNDGELRVKLLDKISESQEILNGFKLHIVELMKQYQNRIKVVSEV